MDPKEFEARRHEFTYQRLSQQIGECREPGQQAVYRAFLDLTETSLEAAYEALRHPAEDMWSKVKMATTLGEVVGELACQIREKENPVGVELRERAKRRLDYPDYCALVQLARSAPDFKR